MKESDKLPLEYPFNEALLKYIDRFGIFLIVMLINAFMFIVTIGITSLSSEIGAIFLTGLIVCGVGLGLWKAFISKAGINNPSGFIQEYTYMNYTRLNQFSYQARSGMLPPTLQRKRTQTIPQEIRILIVEDEDPLRELLQVSLQRSGYQVMAISDSNQALQIFDEQPFDLVLLDTTVAGLDGFTLCAALRQRSDVPIIMLSALIRPDDIVHGFNVGADDYICKPFTFREIEVRLQAILRRTNWMNSRTETAVMSFNDIVLNDELHQVKVRDKLVHLTPTEYQLLRHLMSVPDRPVSKNDLFRTVWGYDLAGGTNLVEVAVRRLRQKIEQNPSDPVYLVNVKETGYKFNTQHVSKSETTVASKRI